jgi:hypothetical protein
LKPIAQCRRFCGNIATSSICRSIPDFTAFSTKLLSINTEGKKQWQKGMMEELKREKPVLAKAKKKSERLDIKTQVKVNLGTKEDV